MRRARRSSSGEDLRVVRMAPRAGATNSGRNSSQAPERQYEMSKFSKLLLAALLTAVFGTALAQDEELSPTVEFTLQGGIGSQGFEWVGVGGEIDGVRNPDLNVS